MDRLVDDPGEWMVRHAVGGCLGEVHQWRGGANGWLAYVGGPENGRRGRRLTEGRRGGGHLERRGVCV